MDGSSAGKAAGAAPSAHEPAASQPTSSKPTKPKTKSQEPKSTGKPSGASSKDSEPGEPLPFPEAAEKANDEGVEAYVRWHMGSLNAILEDPTEGAGKVLAPEVCKSCQSLDELVDAAAEKQVYFPEPYLTVEGVKVEYLTLSQEWSAILSVRQPEADVKRRDGSTESTLPESTGEYEYTLEVLDGELVVTDIVRNLP